MGNWYAGLRAVKHAGKITGDDQDAQLARIIEGVSRQIDRKTRTFFIPRTETHLFRWPPEQLGRSTWIWLNQWLLSISTLQSEAQNSSPTTIASTDYFLEPNDPWAVGGNRYNRIEIDLSSSAAFKSGDTPQRSISVAGDWGYGEDTRSVGTVDGSGLASSSSATEFVCSDASVIDVGDTLLIESERVFVTMQDFAALGSILINDASVTAGKADNIITVDGSHGIVAGEVIRLESEQMLVLRVSTNDLTVERAYNGTVLATHADDTAVHINRTLTIERGANGSTAATHADTTAISVYEPPFDVKVLAVAEAIAVIKQEGAGWGRTIGAGDSESELSGRALSDLRKDVIKGYSRMRVGAS